MSWSDFEIPPFFIVENSEQCINSNIGCLQMWLFRKLVVIVVFWIKLWKIGLTNSIGSLDQKCCNENLLKIAENWTAFHFWRANDVAIKSWKVVWLAFENGFNQFSLRSYKTCRGIEYWFHRQCCRITPTVTFERLFE